MIDSTLIAIGIGVLPNASWDGAKAVAGALAKEPAFRPEIQFRESLAAAVDSTAQDFKVEGGEAEIAWAIADVFRNDEEDPIGTALRRLDALEFSNLSLRLREREFRLALRECLMEQLRPRIPDRASSELVDDIVDKAIDDYRDRLIVALDHDAITRLIFEQALKIDLLLHRLEQGERSALEAESGSAPFPFLTIGPLPPGDFPRTPVEPELLRWLRSGSAAIVIGMAGSGKTTLSTALASRFHKGFRVDVADAAGIVTAHDLALGVSVLAEPENLLVVDNIHANPKLAQVAVETWRKLSDRPGLLLLTRPDANGASPIAVTPPLRSMALRPVPAAFASVANRVVRRSVGLELSPPFMDSWSTRWRDEFAENLVLFEAAVQGALRRGLPTPGGELEVDRSGALFFVDEHLRTLSAAEREALTELSVLGDLELTAPRYLFGEHELEASARAGLVFRHDAFWRTAHPGYAKLVLMAAGADGECPDALLSLVDRAPELASRIKDRLLNRAERSAARAVCRTAVRDPEAVARQLLYAGLERFDSCVEQARRLGGMPVLELRKCLRKVDPAVVRLACLRAEPRSVFRLATKVENDGSVFDIGPMWEAFFAPSQTGEGSAVREATIRAFRKGDFELLANALSRNHTPDTGLEIVNGFEEVKAAEVPGAVARSRCSHLVLLLEALRHASQSHGKSMPSLRSFFDALGSDPSIEVLRRFALSDAKQAAKLLQGLPGEAAEKLIESLTANELSALGAELAALKSTRHLHKFVAAVAYYSPERVEAVAAGVPASFFWGRPQRSSRPSGAYWSAYEWTNSAVITPTAEWRRSDFATVSAALVLATEASGEHKLRLLRDVIGRAVFDRQVSATALPRRAHLLLAVWAKADLGVVDWIAKRDLLAGIRRTAADGPSLAVVGAASLFGVEVPLVHAGRRSVEKAIKRAAPGGYRGKSALLVALGVLTTEEACLHDGSIDALCAGLHIAATRDSRRYEALNLLLSDWKENGLPARKDRLEAFARVGRAAAPSA